MGTLPNPSPSPSPSANTFPNRGPVPNPVPVQTAAPGQKSPSFEEASKLFSLPLSDAADSLGVCPSVLKKVCYDNGLVRWPYRNFLAGKSIEEIKKEAAIEKEKKLAELKAAPSATPAVSTSLSNQSQSTNTSSVQEYPASRMLAQIGGSHTTHSSSKGGAVDEFKYGFPLNGLSSVSYRWWGNKSDTENKQQPGDSVDGGANLLSTEEKENGTEAEPQKESSLSALRNRAAREGREALKLGVYRGCDFKTIDPSKKSVLLQIFKSSLPCEWGDISTES